MTLPDTISAKPFAYRIPLLNATLCKGDARLALECIESPQSCDHAVNRLHRYISQSWDCPFVASFMGGRASLFAIVKALDLKPGDQVLVPAFTCQAVANALSFQAIEIVFVDIETKTFGMNARAARRAVTGRTKALLLQYTFGLISRDTEALCDLAQEYGLRVIEDCAHATGGAYKGEMLGTIGDIAFFSSERSKIVNTVHGGWVITRNPALGKSLLRVYAATPKPPEDYTKALLRTLCREWIDLQTRTKSEISTDDIASSVPAGFAPIPQMQLYERRGLFTQQYNWKMPAEVAALLLHQLQKLPEILQRRRAGALSWLTWASSEKIRHAQCIDGAEPTWLRFPALVDAETKRDASVLAEQLHCDIGTWFTTPIHPQPLDLPACPNGMYACKHCINLPTWLPA